MRPLFQYFCIIFTLFSLVSAQTVVSGNISGHWDSRHSPYHLAGDVLVPAGDSLIVTTGVIIRALGAFEIRISGRLVMTGSRITQGDGIFIEGGQVDLTNCRIDSVTNGVKAFGGTVRVSESTIEEISQNGLEFQSDAQGYTINSVIQNCGRYAIRITNSDHVVVRNNTLTGNSTSATSYPALFIDSCSPDSIKENLIIDNHAQGIGVWALTGSAAPVLLHNLVKGNFTGITIVNATPILRDNIVIANFVSGNFNSGAGLYIGYPSGNPVCTRNLIAGNYYGVSIINNGSANLGDLDNTDHEDDGENIICANTLDGITWNIWNGTPNIIHAQNNYWPDANPDTNLIDLGIYDDDEAATSGAVIFAPTAMTNLVIADLNRDQLVNVADVVRLVEVVISDQLPDPFDYFLGDVNQDFLVNILDVATLIQQIIMLDN